MTDAIAATHQELRVAERRIRALEAAIVGINDVLNELWGREDSKDFAVPIGSIALAKIMDAQNHAFSLVERK